MQRVVELEGASVGGAMVTGVKREEDAWRDDERATGQRGERAWPAWSDTNAEPGSYLLTTSLEFPNTWGLQLAPATAMINGDSDNPQRTNKPKRRGPSVEIQRQIDDAITARSRTSQAYGGASAAQNTITNLNVQEHQEPGTAPPNAQYEYLNHPADILLHAWGDDFVSSLRNIALAMFGCITSLSSITTDTTQSNDYGRNIIARGHDTRSLVYGFLDEWLFNFHDTGFIPKEIHVDEYDAETFQLTSRGNGEVLDLSRHPRGMEVKAITYSAMRVEKSEGRCDIYVVVDI